MSPTTSAVIPTYNRTDLLPDAIECVLGQTYEDFECIVVDDGSDEDTASVLEQFDDPRIKYVEHEENRGLSAAVNTGAEASNGDYIAFLDDDDRWLPEKLEKQLDLIERLSDDVGLVYCWMDYYRGTGEKYRENHAELSGNIFEELLDTQRIGNNSTIFVRSEVFEAVGGFDESLPRGVDGDFLRRVARKFEIDYVPEVLVEYYTDHGNTRITNESRSGIENHIRGTEAKFEKFDLYEYPRRAAKIHADLAYHYLLIGKWRESIRQFKSAFSVAPYEPGVYLWFYRSLRVLPRGQTV